MIDDKPINRDSYCTWFGWIILLYVLFPGLASPADAVIEISSRLPASVGELSCGDIEKVCVKLISADVDRTPNDSGYFEEWNWKLSKGIGKYRSKEIRKYAAVRDNLSPPRHQIITINTEMCFPASTTPRFKYYVRGYEDDAWPNRDDRIPTVEFRATNCACTYCPSPTGVEGDVQQHGIYNSDRKRHVTYSLTMRYPRKNTIRGR